VLGRDALRWILGLSSSPWRRGRWFRTKLERERPQSARLARSLLPSSLFSSWRWATRRRSRPPLSPRRYASIAAVVAGTTLGMMLADVPAVYFGERVLAAGASKDGASGSPRQALHCSARSLSSNPD